MSDNTKVSKDYYTDTITKVKYDRITSILGYFTQPELVDWQVKKGKEGKDQAKTAKSIGTRVHNLIEEHYKTGNFHFTPKELESVKNCMEGYMRWHKIEKPTIYEVEKIILNNELRIGGTIDIVTDLPIMDIKTSEAIRPDYWIQVSIYAHLYHLKDTNIHPYAVLSPCVIPTKTGILRLDKLTSDYEYKVIPYNKGLVDIFIGLLNAYRYYKSFDKEKPEEMTGQVKGMFEPIPKENWTEFHSQI